jgi:outer membrane PBP1 activator LpoA protein
MTSVGLVSENEFEESARSMRAQGRRRPQALAAAVRGADAFLCVLLLALVLAGCTVTDVGADAMTQARDRAKRLLDQGAADVREAVTLGDGDSRQTLDAMADRRIANATAERSRSVLTTASVALLKLGEGRRPDVTILIHATGQAQAGYPEVNVEVYSCASIRFEESGAHDPSVKQVPCPAWVRGYLSPSGEIDIVG